MIDPTKLLRGAFLALALLFLAPMAGIGGSFLGVEAAQAATVSKITVIGNSKDDTGAILKYLTLHVGDAATPDKINSSIAALTATGLFKSVSVSMQGSVLVVKVSENPIVANVLFEGNKKFSDANLVAMIDLVNRGSVDQAGLDRDIQTITKAYTDAGFTGVKVSTKIDPQPDGRDNVTFVIDEGGRTGIAAVNFTGNKAISAWTLKSVIKTHETGWLSWLLQDDNYTQEQVEGDRVTLQQYYANHGYPDAQVTSATAEFNAARNGYFINFTIDEGSFYKFGKIGLETSIAGLDSGQLTGFIHSREGDSFSQAQVDRSVIDIAVEATNLGYPFADVRPRGNSRRSERHHRGDLPHRPGPARLCRAHQHHGQHQDPRFRHSSRAGLLRRRPLQPCPGHAGQGEYRGAGLLLQRRCVGDAGQRPRQGRPRYRSDRTVDRQLRHHRGL